MKKIFCFKITFLTLLLAFTIHTSTLANELETYGAGEWDVIYDRNITVTSSGTNTSTITSGGGDIRVCISGIEARNNFNFQFFTSTGKAVLPTMFLANTSNKPSVYDCLPKIDIRPYVNSNGKVNLYLRLKSQNISSDSVRVVIED
ncbi:hypothetical protein [Sporosarcina aquimarina]|uniref:Uncharacterized protein n=1 Tax=Sporosarcina aquimarina TaxID=114975 RepID=A0ABU4G5M7_9BACL|nr:hypothetical protein [Sporosarcina aquimarina]MDW0110947.1 hypothetical protein [Sporosarcina aquimarina]